MAIPGSGAVSFSMLQTEFGGSNPISLSEYYRGGSYVPSGVSAVPASGQISVSQFYGTQDSDVSIVLSPSGDWDFISNGSPSPNSAKTITSIDATCTLEIRRQDPDVSYQLRYHKNGGAAVNCYDFDTLTVVNGDTLAFSTFGGPTNGFDRVEVYNQTDGGASVGGCSIFFVTI